MYELDRVVVEECLYKFTLWMWRCDLNVTREDIDDFFRECGTTRHEIVAAANKFGIVVTTATFKDPEPSPFMRLLKWIWK